jgi:acyl-CoA thioesterase-1
MVDAARPCVSHPDLVGFKYPLPNLTLSLRRQCKTRIVSIGSSSTAGADNTIPYPCRLELALRKRFFGRMIDVLNRGIGGQEAPEELSRFESDVIGEAPALVIWQVGANAIYRKVDYNFDDVSAAITAGLGWLANLPTDVVLMDPQYTRALVGPDKIDLANEMISRISAAAKDAGVNVFCRFSLMQSWCAQDNVPLGQLDDGGQLHMSDWATDCVTRALMDTIEQKVTAGIA